VDWIFTVPFLLCFISILLIFDLLQRLARPFGSRPHEIVVGLLQVCLIGSLRLCGARLFVERAPEIKPSTPYLILSNHQSMFDIPILGALLFTNYPKYVSKKELARWIPSISYNLRRGGNALIDRGNRRQAVEAIRELGLLVSRRGVSAAIFPEGTRARSGELGVLKSAGALALLKAAPEAAVLPVAIDQSWRLLSRNLLPVPFGVRIRVHLGKPIPRDGSLEDTAIVERAWSEIRGAIERWRAAPGDPAEA
jgi:1-acyl-sn-glycerol-3-phosphate acyltransferase